MANKLNCREKKERDPTDQQQANKTVIIVQEIECHSFILTKAKVSHTKSSHLLYPIDLPNAEVYELK